MFQSSNYTFFSPPSVHVCTHNGVKINQMLIVMYYLFEKHKPYGLASTHLKQDFNVLQRISLTASEFLEHQYLLHRLLMLFPLNENHESLEKNTGLSSRYLVATHS